jgi:hypothetical protein
VPVLSAGVGNPVGVFLVDWFASWDNKSDATVRTLILRWTVPTIVRATRQKSVSGANDGQLDDL